MMALDLPRIAGKLTENAPLAPLVWFKSGGAAEWLFEPKDLADLQHFLRELDPQVPVMALGLGSNLIVRDGGVPGVVVRLGKAFAQVEATDVTTLTCGGGASGFMVTMIQPNQFSTRTVGRAILSLQNASFAVMAGAPRKVPSRL